MIRAAATFAQLFFASLLVALGLELVIVPVLRLVLVGSGLALCGGAWYALTIVSTRKRGRVGDRRLVALMVASALPILVYFGARLVMLGHDENKQRGDVELGWVPVDAPGKIGLRFQPIDPAREQVVFVGDSVVYGSGVGDQETVTAYLEPMLPPYQVLNVAVPGYSIDQYLIYLQRMMPQLRPKLVIVGLFTGNDFQLTGSEVGYAVPKPLFRVQGGALVRADAGNLDKGCLREVSEATLFRFLWRNRPLALSIGDFFCQPLRLDLGETEAVVAKLFAELERVSSERGAKVLFLLLPETKEILRRDRDEERYRSRYRHLRRLLAEGGHSFYEFYPDIMATGREPEIFLDPAHYTPMGHRLLAEKVAEVVRARKLLPAH